MKRVGIYLRLSINWQTTENQRVELEAIAARSGWQVVGAVTAQPIKLDLLGRCSAAPILSVEVTCGAAL